MKNQIQIFMTNQDEEALSQFVKNTFHDTIFLNGNIWKGQPDIKKTLTECNSGLSYLFRGNSRNLPTFQRKNGNLEGPIAGCVVQVLHSRLVKKELISGRVACGFSSSFPETKELFRSILGFLKSNGKIGVLRLDGLVDRNYLVGNHAKAGFFQDRFTLCDAATGLEFLLQESKDEI